MNIYDYISERNQDFLDMYKAYEFVLLEGFPPRDEKIRPVSQIEVHLMQIEELSDVKYKPYSVVLLNIIAILKSDDSNIEIWFGLIKVKAKLEALIFCKKNIANQTAIDEEIEEYKRRLASDRPEWRPNTSVSIYGESYLSELKAFVEFSKHQQDSD